jgi:hypothetical protein
MFRDRLVYLADVVFQYVITPRNLNIACQHLSSIDVLRTSMTFPDTKSGAYNRVVNANNILWPKDCRDAPGDHTAFFVEATANIATRKPKRGRRQLEEEG